MTDRQIQMELCIGPTKYSSSSSQCCRQMQATVQATDPKLTSHPLCWKSMALTHTHASVTIKRAV